MRMKIRRNLIDPLQRLWSRRFENINANEFFMERGMKIAPKRPKLGQYQQTAFAAQNLEDLAMYDIDQDNSCMECAKKFMSTGHFK